MARIGTVIKGLIFHKDGMCTSKKGEVCPYWKFDDNCSKRMITDAIELLQKDKPRNVISILTVEEKTTGFCPKCDSMLNRTYTPKWCGNCGQALNWWE